MRLSEHALTGLVVALLFALTPALTPNAQAQYFGRNKVQYENFDFRSVSTEHYDVYYYPASRVAAEDAARMAERWYVRHARTFEHDYGNKPLILYANDADFQQTNVIEGAISQGTGGVTESLQNRVVMPLTGIYKETDHVLGHELVHTFQYDIVQRPGGGGLRGISRVPLWLVEGMAEYLTIGRDDPHTAMWMRDAVLRDDLPTIEDLSGFEYFPYRYGQAYAAYVGGRWGDDAVTRLFKLAATTGLDSAVVEVTGLDSEALSEAWQEEVRELYTPLLEGRTRPEDLGRPVIAASEDEGDMNIAPAVSPDGRYVAFLSSRGLFSVELYVADARTGRVINQLTETNIDPHFEALRFINSAGTWSPDGQRLAYVVFDEGDNELVIQDVRTEEVTDRIEVTGVGALANPAWSPDGRSLAFTGIHGGISDLFVYDFETERVRQLTDDRYAAIHPEWSPDGRTLAFATDRGPGGTDFERLAYAEPRLGLLDLETNEIRTLVPFPGAKHINPQFSPDGESLYFISDRTGFSNVYRLDLASGDVAQVTDIATGVSGITNLAPALSVADGTGELVFSVYHDNSHSIHALEPPAARAAPVVAEREGLALAGLLPPVEAVRDPGLVGGYLLDPATGLPELTALTPDDYDPSLRVAYIGPPTVGVGYDTQFGAGVAGGVSLFLSDLLGNHLLGGSLQANGGFQDIGGEVFYLNRGSQWNYGVQLSHTPYLSGGTGVTEDPETGNLLYERFLRRTFFTGGDLMAQYPFSSTRRAEAQLGYSRVWYDLDVERALVGPGGNVLDREEESLPAPDALHLAEASAAFVGDYANFAFTSPIAGGRYRFEVGYSAGSFNFGQLLLDYRRYLRFEPVTLALSAYHYGRYFAGDRAERELYPLSLGYSMYNVRGVHGYETNSFDVAECRGGAANCPVFDRVVGSRVAVAAAELRYPLIGTGPIGLIDFPYLPTELALFGDAGLAWTADRAPELAWTTEAEQDNVPVFSVGGAARFNLLGYVVLEFYYAYPFQRPDAGWTFGWGLIQGW